MIESGKPKTLEFGVADETAWKVGLSCGGTIRVYVEKVECWSDWEAVQDRHPPPNPPPQGGGDTRLPRDLPNCGGIA